MEVTKFTKAGHDIIVFFTGAKYYFFSPYYGVIAHAERDYKKSVRDWDRNYNEQHFSLVYGNDHCLGGRLTNSVILSVAKSFICKCENKFVPCTVIFDACTLENLQNKHLTMDIQ